MVWLGAFKFELKSYIQTKQLLLYLFWYIKKCGKTSRCELLDILLYVVSAVGQLYP